MLQDTRSTKALVTKPLSGKSIAKIAKTGIKSPLIVVVFTEDEDGPVVLDDVGNPVLKWVWNATPIEKYNSWTHAGTIVENTELWVARGRAYVTHTKGMHVL